MPGDSRRLIAAFVAVVAVTASVTGGLFTLGASPSEGQSEKLDIGGYATVNAYHSDGTLFATWGGHNALTSQAKNAIASCISGVQSSPYGFNGCKGWTQYIQISDGNNFRTIAKAANALLPNGNPDSRGIDKGCDPKTAVRTPALQDCIGWLTEATFEITKPVTVTELGAGTNLEPRPGQSSGRFDTIAVNPGINLSPGDRLLVTITFNIS